MINRAIYKYSLKIREYLYNKLLHKPRKSEAKKTSRVRKTFYSFRHYKFRHIKLVGKCISFSALLAHQTLAEGASVWQENLSQGLHPDFQDNNICALSAHQQPISKLNPTTFDTDSYPIRIDNCCTRTVTFDRRDFEPGSLRPVYRKQIHGYGGTATPITHQGTVIWKTLDDQGKTQIIRIPGAFYVPGTSHRLLSPQHFSQQSRDHLPKRHGTWCATYDDSIVLQWKQRTITKTCELDPKSTNVATIWSAPGYTKMVAFCTKVPEPEPDYYVCLRAKTTIVDEIDDNIVELDPELINTMQTDTEHLKRTGVITELRNQPIEATFNLDGPTVVNKEISAEDEEIPEHKDPAMELLSWHNKFAHISMTRLQEMATQGQLPKRLAKCRVPMCQACTFGKLTRKPWRSKYANNKQESKAVTAPGQTVSVDQLESYVPGFIGQMKGILTRKRYKVATIFVDNYTNYSYVHLQQTTSSQETLVAKQAFEQHARTFGVNIQHYHADNGRFSDTLWRQDILTKHQKLTFCGVGAHHQNGRAEKRIRDMQDLARTSLIFAHKKWPEAIDSRLWPYALRYANDSINRTFFPGKDKSPLELFSGVEVSPDLKNQHPFGCPAFALDGRLQGHQKIGKWIPRSRMAVFIGQSPQHATSVGLLLSLTTGLVSPQFHAKYDNNFETVTEGQKGIKSLWQVVAGFEEMNMNDLHPKPAKKTKKRSTKETVDIPVTENIDIIPNQQVGPLDHFDWEDPIAINNDPENEGDQLLPDIHHPPPAEEIEPVTTTRSGRRINPPSRFNDYIAYNATTKEYIDFFEPDMENFDPTVLSATSDPDVMYLREALKQPDKKEFIKAMEKEIHAHTTQGNWKIVKRSSVPPHMKILPAVWAMRRKRDIATNVVYKWKARLNVHGGKQELGVNYWQTYAPVASWAHIRLIMIMASLSGWRTHQLDFVLAFPQAPIETELYMEIPEGFSIDGTKSKKDYVLKLVNNLYGQKQAGQVWNGYLTDGLIKIGFTQSIIDPCVFWRGQTLIIIYTDDTVVTGPSEDDIKRAVRDIGTEFEITSQPKVADFLGVKVERDDAKGELTFTQPQLINSILQDLNMNDRTVTKDLPALSSVILHQYRDSPDHHENWSYRSVVGKMNYLEKCTRPDIAYAIHQCARFASEPKEEHTKAVKMIARYLKGTRDKGIICKPNNASLMCYCDADFAGNWNPNIAEECSSTAKSRSGYIITYGGCPIIWASKLQTEIALSTTESEYISLSQALREVIPMMRLIKELEAAGFQFHSGMPKIHCKVFEDNSGALTMARTPKMRPRTKHLNIKYHHFREAVKNGLVSIHGIRTEDQWADIFTKPLGNELFLRFRLAIMGW